MVNWISYAITHAHQRLYLRVPAYTGALLLPAWYKSGSTKSVTCPAGYGGCDEKHLPGLLAATVEVDLLRVLFAFVLMTAVALPLGWGMSGPVIIGLGMLIGLGIRHLTRLARRQSQQARD
jgi:hypothetical protein